MVLQLELSVFLLLLLLHDLLPLAVFVYLTRVDAIATGYVSFVAVLLLLLFVGDALVAANW